MQFVFKVAFILEDIYFLYMDALQSPQFEIDNFIIVVPNSTKKFAVGLVRM